MNLETYLAEECERLKVRHDDGDASAVYEVALLCLWNRTAVPEWAADLAANAIQRDYIRAAGVKGQPKPQLAAERYLADKTICWVFDSILSGGPYFQIFFHGKDKPRSKEQAYVMTAECLSSMKFEGRQHTAEAVKKVIQRHKAGT